MLCVANRVKTQTASNSLWAMVWTYSAQNKNVGAQKCALTCPLVKVRSAQPPWRFERAQDRSRNCRRSLRRRFIWSWFAKWKLVAIVLYFTPYTFINSRLLSRYNYDVCIYIYIYTYIYIYIYIGLFGGSGERSPPGNHQNDPFAYDGDFQFTQCLQNWQAVTFSFQILPQFPKTSLQQPQLCCSS